MEDTMTELDKANLRQIEVNVELTETELTLKRAYTLESLTRAGFTHTSAVEAVTSDDLSRLSAK